MTMSNAIPVLVLLTLILSACGGGREPDMSNKSDLLGFLEEEPVAPIVAGDRDNRTEPNMKEAKPRGAENATPEQGEGREVTYVHAADFALHDALKPVVAAFDSSTERIAFRDHCSWNVKCVDVFWEGVERGYRVACPADVPLRRELSVDASLEGDELDAALVQALADVVVGKCVATGKAYVP